MLINPCAEVAIGKPEKCVISSFINEIIESFLEGTPILVVIVASEVELVMVRHQILMAMPVGIMRHATVTARSYKWEEQEIIFALVGDTLEKKYIFESSTFWTEDACKLGGFDPEKDGANLCQTKLI